MISSIKNMGKFQILRLMHSFRSQRLLSAVAVLILLANLCQFLLVIPFGNYTLSPPFHVNINSIILMSLGNSELSSNESQSTSIDSVDSALDEEARSEEVTSGRELSTDEVPNVGTSNRTEYKAVQEGLKTEFGSVEQRRNQKTFMGNDSGEIRNGVHSVSNYLTSGLLLPKHRSAESKEKVKKKSNKVIIPISKMKASMLQGSSSSNSERPKQLSVLDKKLLNARIQIEDAPIIRDAPKIYASLFRNYSTFIRSYELMEQMLRVYIYKEGQKPIFHYPYLGGVYTSEGWFMELLERNKQYVVRDPRKAHLFYLPFSSRRLRSVCYDQHIPYYGDVEIHLENYVQSIATKYNFWNRTKGADHFLVACHDWALNFTRKSLKGCIRAVCNANPIQGFEIGKDISLPSTMVRGANPLEDIGGIHPSERHILAFFAGKMHGRVRRILLKHWYNKTTDMMIFGPLGHDDRGAARYREFMKSSKYCICARGNNVYSPRVIESINHECVPVIISDNYVPPLFDIFEWESFAVFVPEEDIPNLRNILLSIPESKYIEMHNRVKLVQKHFLWHKNPVKYDIFHMILHSIWHRRVFQV
ncbi:OLC1v1037413C2 [Oldenlandia corymbosa var. corymbosa]|uniref:OLC1v1037413C2 n=1 Tax=Oldenlandia corymbosa var. corymbosa TaxID=529605 RepID=A0AAV1CY95_OLDCO|nr:OLC1v1037413C2 [Oldenlandia corymbosa var. corymbosa]